MPGIDFENELETPLKVVPKIPPSTPETIPHPLFVDSDLRIYIYSQYYFKYPSVIWTCPPLVETTDNKDYDEVM